MKPVAKCVTPSETLDLVGKVIESGHLTTGGMVHKAEQALAAVLGINCAGVVGTNAGTTAMMATLASLKRTDERYNRDVVLVPDNTFLATIEAVWWSGYEPVLYPVDPLTNRVYKDAFESLLSEEVQAIMTTDIGGWVTPDFDYLLETAYSIDACIVQDAAHSAGSHYNGEYKGLVGSHPSNNVFACFSLHPIKTIGGADGGFVCTRNKSIASKIRMFRSHGIEAAQSVEYKGVRSTALGWKYKVGMVGFKCGMSDVQAAFALPLIDDLVHRTATLQAIWDEYEWRIPEYSVLTEAGVVIAPLASYEEATPHLLILDLGEDLAEHRDKICQEMCSRGIQVSVHYQPLHSFEVFEDCIQSMMGNVIQAGFYGSLYGRMLSLPIHIELKPADIEEVVTALAESVGALHVTTGRQSTCDNDSGVRG